MEIASKYFDILQKLNHAEGLRQQESDVEANIKFLQKSLNIETFELYKLQTLRILEYNSDDCNSLWIYACYLYHVLFTIKNNVDFNSSAEENLLSLTNIGNYIGAIKEVSHYGIVVNLPIFLRVSPLFNMKGEDCANRKMHLKSSIDAISDILNIKAITTNTLSDPVIMEIITGIYAYVSEMPESFSDRAKYEKILWRFWQQYSKEKYFRDLLILKSIKNLPYSMQTNLHNDLIGKLSQPNGFRILTKNIVFSSQNSEYIPNWKRYEIVANIIAHRGHKNKFLKSMIKQIFGFIESCLNNNTDKLLIPAGVVALQKIYNIDYRYKKEIINSVYQKFSTLVDPPELLTSVIVMDNSCLIKFVNSLNTYFRGTSMQSLPSELLIRYLPILLNLYFQFSQEIKEKEDLKLLIVQCLSNRKTEELKIIIKKLILDRPTDENEMFYLHNRLIVRLNEKSNLYNVQIAPEEDQIWVNNACILTEILKSCNHNILVYNVFKNILQLFLEEEEENLKKNTYNSQLCDQDDFSNFMHMHFRNRLTIITCLTDLIAYKTFHLQFQENTYEILEFIKQVLKKPTIEDDTFCLFLSIFRGILENSKESTKYNSFCDILKTKKEYVKSVTIRRQIEDIITLIEEGPINFNEPKSQYNVARLLLEESQPYLRVYGMSQIIILINNKDRETIASKHAILAISLHILRDQESYTYLNCIKLLICLMNVFESEVLESLSFEYLNADETTEFRLKIGEAIVKITEELGPLSYKYKDLLVNCFLSGSKSNIPEFRTSSLSNLATVCRRLSYQVYTFFQELVLLVETILKMDTFLPARRAAAMVITQLISGMDNVLDFQDFLIQIYRILNYVSNNDKDEITKVHAQNGLMYLNEKCKAVIFEDQKLEKNIQIIDIGNNKKKGKSHILELN